LGFARRAARRAGHRVVALSTRERKRVPGHVPTPPRPQTGFAAAGLPQGRPHFFAANLLEPAEPANVHCDKEDGKNSINLVHNSPMSILEQQIPPIEERIGSMVGKIIVLALCAVLLWGYSANFLAQIGLF
jgi:hypothetical protein